MYMDPYPRSSAPVSAGMGGIFQPPGWPVRQDEFLRSLGESIQDESTAVSFYTDLLQMACSQGLPEIATRFIRHAIEDEQKHLRKLSTLYWAVTGVGLRTEPRRVEHRNLTDGLQQAMEDEYKAFEEYRALYLAQNDEQLRNLFFQLMTDELEHATRFQYVLQIANQPHAR